MFAAMDSPEDNSQDDSRSGALRSLWRSVTEFFGGSPEERFSSALIALAAKMAKADGVATQGEFDAFRQVFAFDEVKLPQTPIIHGDAKSFTIAAASILAKVTRDRRMLEYHREYPRYGFDRHKGYGTAFHREIIRKYGPCPVHRRSFLKNILGSSAGE